MSRSNVRCDPSHCIGSICCTQTADVNSIAAVDLRAPCKETALPFTSSHRVRSCACVLCMRAFHRWKWKHVFVSAAVSALNAFRDGSGSTRVCHSSRPFKCVWVSCSFNSLCCWEIDELHKSNRMRRYNMNRDTNPSKRIQMTHKQIILLILYFFCCQCVAACVALIIQADTFIWWQTFNDDLFLSLYGYCWGKNEVHFMLSIRLVR